MISHHSWSKAFMLTCTHTVVIGIPNAPLTRSVVLDLERRGFIVYVVASTSSEEQLIKDHGKSEILPLHLNVTSVRIKFL